VPDIIGPPPRALRGYRLLALVVAILVGFCVLTGLALATVIDGHLSRPVDPAGATAGRSSAA
jgi:hypothetical protein